MYYISSKRIQANRKLAAHYVFVKYSSCDLEKDLSFRYLVWCVVSKMANLRKFTNIFLKVQKKEDKN